MDLIKSTKKCNIIAIPYPGRGHINPLMNFCKQLISTAQPNNNIQITVVVTEEWQELLSPDPVPETMRFVAIPNVLPLEGSRGKSFQAFVEAILTKMEPAVDSLLDRLEIPDPSIILSDAYLRWALKIGRRRNIPVAPFWTVSATMYSIFHHFDLLLQNGHFQAIPTGAEWGEKVVDYIPGLAPICLADFPPQIHGAGPEILAVTLDVIKSIPVEAKCLLFTSYYELESSAIDALKAKFPIPIYTIGPAIPYWTLKEDNSSSDVVDYSGWLNSQPKSSVLYISFGTYISVSSLQIDEIAAGIVDSGVRFFWVIREDVSRWEMGKDNRGLIVPWCDQIKVLCHPSIGGFWSHCGWNSTKEGAFSGVPMLTFPLKWDQYPNSKHIVEDWKMGQRLKKSDGSFVSREEISGVLRKFMDLDWDEGKEMRRRAQEVKEICRRAIAEGGSSQLQIEAFFTEIHGFSPQNQLAMRGVDHLLLY
ncbi:OLC1v1006333C1 [Oldenlandia corymbosa var. corymbosa]|uniref:OLC1v1006333C1 n=1 Tax=Oldenlandia corymbosa var. corymbosa TaxID=529605 RepID=A0AAV1DHD5_OLDCO|nr:OLC1v1006333C1 [Oldenlandia corymbosa var. corymbosa]